MARAAGHGDGGDVRNLFRTPVTVHYPRVTRPYPDRFRGVLALTYDPETGEENCIGCRLCEFICPPQVIKVEMLKAEKRNYAKLFTLELYACEFCELCVQVCPTDAIIMLRTFDLATPTAGSCSSTRTASTPSAGSSRASWATGTGLRAMQARRRGGRQGRGRQGRRRVSPARRALQGRCRVIGRGARAPGSAAWSSGASLGVVLARNLFHAVLWLALALVATAGLFLLLHAEFLAAVQVLLYAGGVVTIVVFAIMLTERLVGGLPPPDEPRHRRRRGGGGGRVRRAGGHHPPGGAARAPAGAAALTTAALGRAVLTEWVLAFEVLGVLLVAALLGALYLARTEE